tara:strand:+ start:3518 stop:3928 length:411 start_codon:yes stop_codon:yes gene_type:complete
MGRFYQGDIEGKFWVGVQPSDDADFFGVEGIEVEDPDEPEALDYEFYKEHEPSVRDGLKTCLKELGDTKPHLDEFFMKNDSYNDKILIDYLQSKMGWRYSENEVIDLLGWYARYDLGTEILGSITKHGQCVFEAEC